MRELKDSEARPPWAIKLNRGFVGAIHTEKGLTPKDTKAQKATGNQ